MKIFLATLGSAGDVYPFIAIGESLIQAGYDVYLCTNPFFEKTALERHLKFISVGTNENYLAAVNSKRLWHPKYAYKEICHFMMQQQQPLYDALNSVTDESSIILTSLWAFSAKMLSEKKGCCVIPVRVSPSTFMSAYDTALHRYTAWLSHFPFRIRSVMLGLIERYIIDRELAPDINQFRASIGLPKIHKILTSWTHKTDSNVICLFPDWFAAPQPDWPQHIKQVGFPLFNLLAHQETDDLDCFFNASNKTVIFMPSWALSANNSVVAELIVKVRKKGFQCLIIGKKNSLYDHDKGIRIENHINLEKYLHRCVAIIHHGGIGTTAQSFFAGIPQLIIPSAFDQFDNARRISNLNCGLALSETDDAILDEKLGRILFDRSISQHCCSIKNQFQANQNVYEQIVATVRAAQLNHAPPMV
ncbi:glycosyltransferase [Prodigiosinella aquatilis]|nr:nucleotide disphospho-sugar-binding domain-containing protein [Prodigiosinella sp. LS101]WJV52481.1 glycosyltransferase [Prodigiosinella sp. LS101]WJV56835.1 glycosyltransferase [Pectobacteriaceae bacterium C111]